MVNRVQKNPNIFGLICKISINQPYGFVDRLNSIEFNVKRMSTDLLLETYHYCSIKFINHKLPTSSRQTLIGRKGCGLRPKNYAAIFNCVRELLSLFCLSLFCNHVLPTHQQQPIYRHKFRPRYECLADDKSKSKWLLYHLPAVRWISAVANEICKLCLKRSC